MPWLCWILLFLSSAAIAYQDFRTRLISIWLIICFGIASITQFLLAYSFYDLLENSIFCLSYFLFSYLVLVLFYFVKTKRFQKILDDKIGWGDIWMMFLTGCCLAPVDLIYFFTLTFIFAILVHALFSGTHKNIALAGIIVICYSIYLICRNLAYLI
jgi:hypothetical protein